MSTNDPEYDEVEEVLSSLIDEIEALFRSFTGSQPSAAHVLDLVKSKMNDPRSSTRKLRNFQNLSYSFTRDELRGALVVTNILSADNPDATLLRDILVREQERRQLAVASEASRILGVDG
jgi:hypothetical protein